MQPIESEEHAVRGSSDSSHDYLVLSDVHLGSDLVPHVRPWARDAWLTSDAEVDARLIGLLSHYRARPESARRVCLIIAGDFLDLVGVSLSADPAVITTQPTREERRHGLGSAHDHVVQKVRAIAQRHRRVFAALCDFVAQGHQLVVVRGNHDIELHWRAAQSALIRAVSQHAPDLASARDVESRIRVCAWFFAVRGLLYVEHGHEFDAMCSYGDPLLPTCPRNSRRIRLSPFAVMLRQVARPTRGLSSRSYENVGFGAYLRLIWTLGVSGSAGIAVRFARAVSCLLGECSAHARGDGAWRALRSQAQRRRFAARTHTELSTLRQLNQLYVRPAACSFSFVLRSLYLDRVLAILLAFFCVGLGAYLARYRALLDGVLYALPATFLTAYACLTPNRDLAPTTRMRAGAARIARLFDARYVVMGHTHEVENVQLAAGGRYVNVGHWGQDDVPEERSGQEPAMPCTYLWLAAATGHRAELLRWDMTMGPRSYSPEQRDPAVSGEGAHAPLPQSA